MKTRMKYLAMAAAASIVMFACSSNEPGDEARVEMKTSMTNDNVYAVEKTAGDAVQGGSAIDSIRIDSVRILISRIKLHRSADDTTGESHDVKVGPTVIHFNRDTTNTQTVVFNEPIPVGNYYKMKFEMHRFSPSEAANYAADPEFGPFAFPERITIIVDGTVYVDSNSRQFTFTDDRTENFWIYFDPYLDVQPGTTTINWEFDGNKVFRAAGRLLDPDDDHDRGDIKEGMKHCWKLFKHKWHR